MKVYKVMVRTLKKGTIESLDRKRSSDCQPQRWQDLEKDLEEHEEGRIRMHLEDLQLKGLWSASNQKA